jgi:tetratricopeptide (TPR) repeat protein
MAKPSDTMVFTRKLARNGLIATYQLPVSLRASGVGNLLTHTATTFMPNTVCFKRLRPTRTFFALGLVVAALVSPAAWADDYADVNRLLKNGQPTEAMAKVDQFLVGKPRDPQMRFLKGVILAETGKSNEAIATFVKLTEEFPELPEPYNNLAVLYAGQSQFDKARVALEMAIRTNPSYATAHENLGDVYAKLASQAYSKALQLDGSNAGVPPKLALIRNLFAPEGRSGKAASAAATVTVPAAPSAKPGSTVAVTAIPVTPTASTTSASDASQDVISAVQAWAKAWASKDVGAYLGAYSDTFDPPGQQSRKAWEGERRDRIVSKRSISVEVSDFDVKMSDAKATVSFRQKYKSGTLVANSRKTLEMLRQGGRWLITRESSGG